MCILKIFKFTPIAYCLWLKNNQFNYIILTNLTYYVILQNFFYFLLFSPRKNEIALYTSVWNKQMNNLLISLIKQNLKILNYKIFYKKGILMQGEKFKCKIWNKTYIYFKFGLTHNIVLRIPKHLKLLVKKLKARLKTLIFIYGLNIQQVNLLCKRICKLKRKERYRKVGIYDLAKPVKLYAKKLK